MTDTNDTVPIDKNQVSFFYYAFVVCITAVMAIGLAIQNGMFGFEQGTSEFRSWITAGLFFVGDLALIAACHRFLHKNVAAVLCIISIFGFSALSGYAAFAFLTGQQSQKDNFLILEKRTQIAEIRKDKNALPGNYFTKKMEYQSSINKLTEEIQVEQKRTGYVSAGSAGYALIAKATPYSFDQVSLSARVSWSVVFIIGSIAFGGLLGSMEIKKKTKKIKGRKNQTKPETHENTSTQDVDSSATNSKQYDKALAWVKKRGVPGTGFFVKDLKPLISTKDKVQRQIINQLLDNKEIDRVKQGTGYAYSLFKPDTPKSIEKPAEIVTEPSKKSNVFSFLAGKSK